jgi:hypothetical protein
MWSIYMTWKAYSIKSPNNKLISGPDGNLIMNEWTPAGRYELEEFILKNAPLLEHCVIVTIQEVEEPESEHEIYE